MQKLDINEESDEFDMLKVFGENQNCHKMALGVVFKLEIARATQLAPQGVIQEFDKDPKISTSKFSRNFPNFLCRNDSTEILRISTRNHARFPSLLPGTHFLSYNEDLPKIDQWAITWAEVPGDDFCEDYY